MHRSTIYINIYLYINVQVVGNVVASSSASKANSASRTFDRLAGRRSGIAVITASHCVRTYHNEEISLGLFCDLFCDMPSTATTKMPPVNESKLNI